MNCVSDVLCAEASLEGLGQAKYLYKIFSPVWSKKDYFFTQAMLNLRNIYLIFLFKLFFFKNVIY